MIKGFVHHTVSMHFTWKWCCATYWIISLCCRFVFHCNKMSQHIKRPHKESFILPSLHNVMKRKRFPHNWSLWWDTTNWVPSQRVSNAEFWFVVLLAASLNGLLNKQPSCRWFETPFVRVWWCFVIGRYDPYPPGPLLITRFNFNK